MDKPTMGRPKIANKKQKVVFYLSPELIEKINQLAQDESLSTSQFVQKRLDNSLRGQK